MIIGVSVQFSESSRAWTFEFSIREDEALEAMSVPQLREEARRYRLGSSGGRKELIDNIASHLERHGPVSDLLGARGDVSVPEGVPRGPEEIVENPHCWSLLLVYAR